jgi:AAA15 family ATPase/GTPase
MILDFTVKNFMSIKDTTTLDFVVPTDYLKEKDKPDPRIVKVDIQGGKKSIYVNKALVIYGANASGKSNILLAIHEFFRTIKNSINP